MGLASSVQERLFRHIHGNTLVYNTCWEDPRCDRRLMQFGPESRVAMLTSAGCNALEYLLDDCAEIHCVDLNPRQNALLELKIALIEAGDFEALFAFFGKGGTPQASAIFEDLARPRLRNPETAQYWSQNLSYFEKKGLRPSFYWRGSSGTVAWLIRQWIHTRPELTRLVRQLFEAGTLDEQRLLYEQLEPKFLNRFVSWLMRRHLIQSMLGVPKSQQYLAAQRFEDGMTGYLRQCLRQVFAELPMTDNYFWKLYFDGHYQAACCPTYLDAANFAPLQSRVGRITTHTRSFSQFLQQNPGQYTHFILLDHQDWLASHLQHALEEEWRLIFANAAPGARVLLRSASYEPDFLPAFVHEKVRFDHEATQAVHVTDRVGTYASTWAGVILP